MLSVRRIKLIKCKWRDIAYIGIVDYFFQAIMEEEENLLRQQEEIEVLNSIYEENLVLGRD